MITGLMKNYEASPPLWIRKNLKIFLHISRFWVYVLSGVQPPDFFATFLIVAKKCCKDFEKCGQCCKVNVARILALSKMLQSSCCKNFEIFRNIHFSNVAKKKKTYASKTPERPLRPLGDL